MSSFTSSSRKLYLKLWLLILLGMAIAMSLVRLFTYAVGASGEEFLGGPLTALKYLPTIAQEEQPQVMVFGSSMVQAGFSPRQFDRELKEQGIDIKSYNFGFGGLNPYFQDFFSRRIKEQYQANNNRLTLAIIEFNPFQTTQARYQGALPIMDAYLGMLASPEELLDIAMENPTRGALIYNIKYLRDNISAEMITYFFGRPFRGGRPRPDVEPDTEEQVQRRRELGEKLTERFEQDYPDFEDSRWVYQWQGGGTIPEERSEGTVELFADYYDSLRTPYRMHSDLLWREQSADITHLRFQEELVEAFIRIVENFQTFSDEVVVVMLPKNTKWIKNPPEALERQAKVVERIKQQTGVTVLDYQYRTEFTPEMFSDTTHLARYSGDIVFTTLLSKDVNSLLEQGHF